MAKEQLFTASFHGHSLYSDGLSKMPALVKKAAESGVNFFGVSDHNTTNGLWSLHRTIEDINGIYEKEIVPISAFEVTTNQGDVVIARPGEYTHEFACWGNKWSSERGKHNLLETINTAVKSFDAIAVIVHPDEPLLSGVPVNVIKALPSFLEPEVLKNVGIEVHNWSTLLLPKRARTREIAVARLAISLNLARFGLSDFHHTWQIPTQLTNVCAGSLSPEAFILAVQGRKVWPKEGKKLTPVNWIKLLVTFTATHFKHPNFSK